VVKTKSGFIKKFDEQSPGDCGAPGIRHAVLGCHASYSAHFFTWNLYLGIVNGRGVLLAALPTNTASIWWEAVNISDVRASTHVRPQQGNPGGDTCDLAYGI
jgi:hypothetical protein